jgi:hypothetical protein
MEDDEEEAPDTLVLRMLKSCEALELTDEEFDTVLDHCQAFVHVIQHHEPEKDLGVSEKAFATCLTLYQYMLDEIVNDPEEETPPEEALIITVAAALASGARSTHG